MHSPGPWHACQNGDCQCKHIWTAHHPVAEVIAGKWGDKYPALRIEGGSLEMTAVPIIEMIEYGEVDEETAISNARLIAAAPTLLQTLKDLEVKTPEVLAAIALAENGDETYSARTKDSLRFLDSLQKANQLSRTYTPEQTAEAQAVSSLRSKLKRILSQSV